MKCDSCGKPAVDQHHCDRWDCPILRRFQPTPERLRQSLVDAPAEVVTYDADGRPSRSLAPRACDTLGRMLRRGSISEEMANAGNRFREDFQRANLDPLRAADMGRESSSGGFAYVYPTQNQAARDRTWGALMAVGGLGSPGGSVLWHVVGWERTLKQWALEQGWSGRFVSEEAASGMLISALGSLDAHYGGKKTR